MTKVLYPGSFDPITKGHMKVIDKAAKLFDEVVIAIMTNSKKKTPLFTVEQCIQLIKSIYQDVDNIKVISRNGATVDIANFAAKSNIFLCEASFLKGQIRNI